MRVWGVVCGSGCAVGTGALAQTTADVTDEGVVMHVDLAWDLEDIQTFVARSESRAVATWQTPLSEEWHGVEVLDLQEEWLPLESEMQEEWGRASGAAARPSLGRGWLTGMGSRRCCAEVAP